MSTARCYGHELAPDDPALAGLELPLADASTRYILRRDLHRRLAVFNRDKPRQRPLQIDFHGAEMKRRIQAGRQQVFARACGLHKVGPLRVLDATAGLGRDAYCLAALGCEVLMYERDPLLYAMLRDALTQLPTDATANLRLQPQDSNQAAWPPCDVVYLDPMFPDQGRRAAPGLEMQYLHQLLGPDKDAIQLWQKAMRCGARRVVLKRPPRGARVRLGKPDCSFGGARVVYDVYLPPRTASTGQQPKGD